MMLRKQTVWLLTMLAVMVVLSGYYLVKGPAEQMPAVGEENITEEPLGIEVESAQTNEPATETAKEAEETGQAGEPAAALPDAGTTGGSEFFLGYKMKREAMLQQQKDEQRSIMTDPEASPQAIAEAKAKYEELSDTERAVLALEEVIKSKGYKEVVVTPSEQTVSVYVQKEKLEAKEVVDIIALVKQHLNVPGTQVVVSAKP